MNCRVGDLALVTRATLPENLGRMVTCLRVERPKTLMHSSLDGEVIWRLDETLTWYLADGTQLKIPYAPDSALLPIRPEPDEDEDEASRSLETVSHVWE